MENVLHNAFIPTVRSFANGFSQAMIAPMTSLIRNVLDTLTTSMDVAYISCHIPAWSNAAVLTPDYAKLNMLDAHDGSALCVLVSKHNCGLAERDYNQGRAFEFLDTPLPAWAQTTRELFAIGFTAVTICKDVDGAGWMVWRLRNAQYQVHVFKEMLEINLKPLPEGVDLNRNPSLEHGKGIHLKVTPIAKTQNSSISGAHIPASVPLCDPALTKSDINTFIGAHAPNNVPLYDKDAHASLTAACRAASGYGGLTQIEEPGLAVSIGEGGNVQIEGAVDTTQEGTAKPVHRQLSKTDEWLLEKLEASNAVGDAANRDYFNMWTAGSQSSPLATHILEGMPQSFAIGNVALGAADDDAALQQALNQAAQMQIRGSVIPQDSYIFHSSVSESSYAQSVQRAARGELDEITNIRLGDASSRDE